MGKNKKKNQYRKDDSNNATLKYTEKPRREKVEPVPRPEYDSRREEKPSQTKNTTYHPVAMLLRDAISEQIEIFLDNEPTEKTAAELFNLGSYPARLTGCEGAEDYEAYQLDRSVRLNRDDPSKLNRLSTIIVVLNMATHRPAFLVQAFISPNRTARVIIHEQTETGTNYRNTLRWANDQD